MDGRLHSCVLKPTSDHVSLLEGLHGTALSTRRHADLPVAARTHARPCRLSERCPRLPRCSAGLPALFRACQAPSHLRAFAPAAPLPGTPFPQRATCLLPRPLLGPAAPPLSDSPSLDNRAAPRGLRRAAQPAARPGCTHPLVFTFCLRTRTRSHGARGPSLLIHVRCAILHQG